LGHRTSKWPGAAHGALRTGTSRRRRAVDTIALLLTGRPGVGKTTVIRAVADALPRGRLGGFFTDEIRVRGERRGFALVTFEGRRLTLAHVERHGPPRVGKYGADVDALEAVEPTGPALRPDVSRYRVDQPPTMHSPPPPFSPAPPAPPPP